MGRPRKSTVDNFVDMFAEFDATSQAEVLVIIRQVHRLALRKRPTPAEILDPQRNAALEMDECLCRFHGDQADARDCTIHGVSRTPAVPLVMEVGPDEAPF